MSTPSRRWRVAKPDHFKTSSLDSELQALAKFGYPEARLRWVTVARGNGLDLQIIADVMNRSGVIFGEKS